MTLYPKFIATAESLEVAYGESVALSLASLNLESNIGAIIGHNGSGKSTLMKAFLGLIPPRAGKYFLHWAETGEPLIPEKHMAFSPENGAVFADISVESFFRFWSRLKHGDVNVYKKDFSDIIDALGIPPLFPKLGRELSKGQRRRVQLAVGFLIRPRLFLLDEPFDGLDVQQSNELSSIVRQHSQKMAFGISSHRMDVIERLADTVVVLKEGQVYSQGNVQSVCRTLAGLSYRIDANGSAHRLTPDVIRHVEKACAPAIAHRIGEVLVVVGQGVSEERLHQTLSALELRPREVVPNAVSLVDAMDYHLSSRHHNF